MRPYDGCIFRVFKDSETESGEAPPDLVSSAHAAKLISGKKKSEGRSPKASFPEAHSIKVSTYHLATDILVPQRTNLMLSFCSQRLMFMYVKITEDHFIGPSASQDKLSRR